MSVHTRQHDAHKKVNAMLTQSVKEAEKHKVNVAINLKLNPYSVDRVSLQWRKGTLDYSRTQLARKYTLLKLQLALFLALSLKYTSNEIFIILKLQIHNTLLIV